jgi:DNA-binding transcriptional MerR regulator
MAQQQPIRNKTATTTREIPDKLYFRIGEVARLCEVPAYVLRFWESEFPQLKPNKGGTGQRLYRRRDVEMALRVKALLYDEGYTIAGARQVFKGEQRQTAPQLALAIEDGPKIALGKTELQHLRRLRKELQDLHTLLSQPPGTKPATAPVQSIRALRRRPETEPNRDDLFEDPSSAPDLFPPNNA